MQKSCAQHHPHQQDKALIRDLSILLVEWEKEIQCHDRGHEITNPNNALVKV